MNRFRETEMIVALNDSRVHKMDYAVKKQSVDKQSVNYTPCK